MSWTTQSDGYRHTAFNTSTSAVNMKQHRKALREQAEARNAVTPHDRTSQHQKGKCCKTEE